MIIYSLTSLFVEDPKLQMRCDEQCSMYGSYMLLEYGNYLEIGPISHQETYGVMGEYCTC